MVIKNRACVLYDLKSLLYTLQSSVFHDDIFPPTASAIPSLTADEWISGQNREPILISMKVSTF